MDLIDRDEAIEVLQKIKAKRESCNCSRQSIIEANALGYAIGVLKAVKSINVEASEHSRLERMEEKANQDSQKG